MCLAIRERYRNRAVFRAARSGTTTPVREWDRRNCGKRTPVKRLRRVLRGCSLRRNGVSDVRHSPTIPTRRPASPQTPWGVALEVVSDTLGHTSIRVTMDVYGHPLAPAKMQAADTMWCALLVEDLLLDPLAAGFAANADGESPHSPVTSASVEFSWLERADGFGGLWASVGRPGLDPDRSDNGDILRFVEVRSRSSARVRCGQVHGNTPKSFPGAASFGCNFRRHIATRDAPIVTL